MTDYFIFLQCGVNANAIDRMLLRSSKPSLHTNVDCNALVAAIISRQVFVVRQLLQVLGLLLALTVMYCDLNDAFIGIFFYV